MQVLILSAIYLILYGAAGTLLQPLIIKLHLSAGATRALGYAVVFAAAFLLMFWGFAPNPLATLSWLRWGPWGASAICFGIASELFIEAKLISKFA